MCACGFIWPAHNVAIFSAIKIVPSLRMEWNRPLFQGVPGRASCFRKHTPRLQFSTTWVYLSTAIVDSPILVSFPPSPSLGCFPSRPRLTPNLCQAKDKLSIWDIIHWLNLFSGVSWGYPDQWLQANIWAPMALCHPKRWKELRKGKRPTGGVRKGRSERFRLRLTGIWQRGFRARMTHCGYSISWVSLRDLTAPGKDSFFISYNVTVIQPQREKPSANHGSRSQWTRCAE